MRDAFVRRVMDDVPSVDYDEAIRAEVMKSAIAALPLKVRAVWSDKVLRGYINTSFFSAANGVSVAGVPMPNGENYKTAKEHLNDAVIELVASRKTQMDRRDALFSKLKQCAYSVTTRKSLAGMLPEFEKYLPADETAALRSVPVVANVVADFVKAGWPKDHKHKAIAK